MSPLVSIEKFSYADGVRAGKKRILGQCQSLINTSPSIGQGERVRTGYSAYSWAGGNVAAPTGLEITKIVPIQSPSQEDIHIGFATSGVFMTPFWRKDGATTSTKISNENLKLQESLNLGTNIAGINTPTSHQCYTNSVLINTVNDYYNNWIIHNVTLNVYNIITDYSYYDDDGVVGIFTLLYSIDLWDVSHSYILYKNFHDDVSFSPTYNNSKINPPSVIYDSNQIIVSGGQSSNVGNKSIVIIPDMDRTFFPNVDGGYKYQGTYVSKERLLGTNVINNILQNTDTDISTKLPTGTYFYAYAPVFDGYQVGELSGITYSHITGDKNNTVSIKINLSKLNKRITGYYFFVSFSEDTTITTPTSSFLQLGGYISIVDTSFIGFFLDNDSGKYTYVYSLIHTKKSIIGGSYEDSISGISEKATDTSYSYSQREIVAGKHFISNFYIYSEAKADKTSVITNPVGGGTVNGGIVANSVFSNELGRYRFPVYPTLGTKINSVVNIGQDECLILKDKGTIHTRVGDVGGVPDLQYTLISSIVGLTTPNETCKDDEGWVYFPSYNDIYRYKTGNLQPLIEDKNYNDWLDTYRRISIAKKETATVFFIPELQQIQFLFGNTDTPPDNYNDLQFALYLGYGWRQVRYGITVTDGVMSGALHSFRWITKKLNGDVIGSYNGTNALFKFDTDLTTSGSFDDNGVTIPTIIDTGEFVFDETKDIILDKVIIGCGYTNAPSGDRTCTMYLDGTSVKSFSITNTSDKRIIVPLFATDRRVGNTFRLLYTGVEYAYDLKINSIEIYGDLRERSKRV